MKSKRHKIIPTFLCALVCHLSGLAAQRPTAMGNYSSNDSISRTSSVVSPQKVTKEVSLNGTNLAQANYCIIKQGERYATNTGMKPEVVFNGNTVISYGICIILNGWFDFKENSPIIIKLSNGEIIEGKAVSDGKKEANDYREIDPLAYYKFTTTSYIFSADDIKKLRQYGVTKIRLSDGIKNHDLIVNANASAELLNGFTFLEEYVKDKPTIYDDF